VTSVLVLVLVVVVGLGVAAWRSTAEENPPKVTYPGFPIDEEIYEEEMRLEREEEVE